MPLEIARGIFTQENIDEVFNEYLHDPALSDERDCYAHYQEELDREATFREPPVSKADTLEELAEKIGCPADALVKTVRDYNAYCAAGKDEEFGKDTAFLKARENGPYYAICGQRFSECAMGGRVRFP